MTRYRPHRRAPRLFGTARTIALTALLACNGAGVASARPFAETLGAPAGSDTERAREAASRYELGALAFRNARYREAVANFLAADALVPSAALSYNIALAYDKLEETARALSFYRDYLRRRAEGENSEEVAARIRALELELMKKGVQQLTVLSEPPGAILRIEEEPVGRTPWTGEVRPGEHRLTLTRKGHLPATRTVLLPAANAIDVRVRLEPEIAEKEPLVAAVEPPPPERLVKKRVALTPLPEPGPPPPPSSRSTVVPWLTVGVGAAALAASGTFELLRQQSETEAESALTEQQREKREDQADRYRTTSLVLLGTGGGLVLTGAALLLFGGSSSDPSPAARNRPDATAAVGCIAGGCFGTYRTRF
jgi:hypothetical protein